MGFELWFLVVGAVLVAMALAGSFLKRLPLSSSMLYLAAGFLLGPAGIRLFDLDILDRAALVEHVTEIAVIVSLFTAGLKLRLPLSDRRWRPAVLLATFSMALSVGLVAALGVFALGLSIGAAVLLGAVLSPTDPVLASDVQVEHAHDQERVRFSLTAEAGLNDGTAFPFVMLGLGLLGLHELGHAAGRWALVDLLWAVAAGLATGAIAGTAVGRLVVHLRRVHRQSAGLEDFLALGLIALSYGVALLIESYGFLAVFAAGVALRRMERRDAEEFEAPGTGGGPEVEEASPARLAEAVQGFNEQFERLGEVAIVLMVGGMLAHATWRPGMLWLVPALFLVIRPASVFLSLLGAPLSTLQRLFIGWFGVRGIGSIYYLAFVLARGLEGDLARLLADLTLAVVSVSIVLHGVSVTPLMSWYERRRAKARAVSAREG